VATLFPVEARALALIAGAKLAFHLATASLYGLHRDEFYYLAAGRHPAAGYVDQPPLTPLAYRAWSAIFGSSQLSLHAMAAALSVPMVVLAALMARELGGGRWAQRVTMTVAAVGTIFTTTFHFASTATFDLEFWALATWLLLRLLRTGDGRLWAPIGAVAGVGFENKHTMVVWCAAVALGLLVCRRWRLLATGWLAVGAALFVVLATPNLVWQATHHWTSLTFYSALRHRTASQNLVLFWPMQLGLMTAAGTVLVVGGLRWLRRHADAEPFRPLWPAFAAVVVFYFVTAGKGYYPGSIYLPVVAAGAVAVERAWTAAGRRRLLAAVVATGLVAAPVFTPILPAGAATSLGLDKINSDLGAMLGWRDIVDQLAGVYRALPAAQQGSAVFLTRDYSEASALTYWRHEEKVPAAISGHNNVWLWGWAPAAHARTVIAVGIPPSTLDRYFATVTLAGKLHARHGAIDPIEDGVRVWVCTGRRAPWATMWPSLRFYA